MKPSIKNLERHCLDSDSLSPKFSKFSVINDSDKVKETFDFGNWGENQYIFSHVNEKKCWTSKRCALRWESFLFKRSVDDDKKIWLAGKFKKTARLSWS